MNEKQKLVPERFLSLDNNMSLEKIILANDSKEPLVGKVVLWKSKAKHLDVDLGNGIHGILPIDNASIYPSLLPNGVPTASIRAIFGKPCIVSVESVDTTGTDPIIILSRKELMLDAFNIISNLIGEETECSITSFSSFGAFVDVGFGVSGLIPFKELSLPRIRDLSDMGLNIGDKITAKILSVDDNFHVTLNYKDQFENIALTLDIGDLITVTLLDQHNSDGYFAYFNPNTSILVDVPVGGPFSYGDRVVARVKKFKSLHPSKLNLSFVSFE